MMINHTLIFSFQDDIPDSELDAFLRDVERTISDTGTLTSFAARRSIWLAGDDHAEVFVATAIAQMGFADVDALNTAFKAPGLADMIARWNARFPYKTVWANHQPLQ